MKNTLSKLFNDTFSRFDDLFNDELFSSISNEFSFNKNYPTVVDEKENNRFIVTFNVPGFLKEDIKELNYDTKLNILSLKMEKDEGGTVFNQKLTITNRNDINVNDVEPIFENGQLILNMHYVIVVSNQNLLEITVK